MRRFSILISIGLVFSYCKKSGADGNNAGDVSGGAAAYQTSAQIGAAGGTITDPNGNWTFTVPAGALSENKTITVTTNATAPGTIPDEYTAANNVLRFEPAGLTFFTAATLKVKYHQGEMTEGGIEEKLLKQNYLTSDSKVAAMSSTVNMTTNEVTAQVLHFSFSATLTNSIRRVNTGATTRPSSVRRVANRVIAHFNSLANDAARNAEYAANKALLDAFVAKLVQILGSDILTAAFPNADFNGNGIANNIDPIAPVTGATVTLVSSGSLFVSTNPGAINSTQFVWRSSASGTYSIRRNGTTCSDGTVVQSGSVTLNVDNTHSPISAASLQTGDNEFRICVTAGPNTTFYLLVIARDEVYPVSAASPAGGTFTTAQNVSMTCLDTGDAGCEQIAYTTNGTDPTFDAAGNVTNGVLYSAMWLVSPGSTGVRIMSRDEAGNVGPIVQLVFSGAAQTPPTTYAVPNGGAFTSAQSVTLTCVDSYGSGCKRIVYTVDGSEPKFSPANGTIVSGNIATLTISNGETLLRTRSENNVGLIEPYRELNFSVSNTGFTYAATGRGLSRGIGPNPSTFVTTTAGDWTRIVRKDSITGITYVAAPLSGLFLSTDNEQTWTRRTTVHGLGSNTVMDVWSLGSLVFVATDNGLSISSDSGATFINKTTANGLAHNSVRKLFVSGNKLYLATQGGLSISADNGITFSNRTTANGLGSNDLHSIFVHDTSVFTAGLGGIGVSNDDGNTFVSRTSANGLVSTYQQFVYFSENVIYAGTALGGGLAISIDNGLTFTYRGTAQGLGDSGTHCAYSAAGIIYVCTAGGLSLSSDGGVSFTTKTTAQGLGQNNVRDIHISNNSLYLATTGGISISTNGGTTFTNKIPSTGLGASGIRNIHAQGVNLLAATSNGISISSDGGGNFVTKNTSHGLGTNNVTQVFREGLNIYAATLAGLAISTDGGTTFVNRTTLNGLGNNYLHCVFASGSTIYAGTNEGGLGISIDSGATFTSRTMANGLGENLIYDVLAVGTNVYAGVYNGVSISNNGGTTFVHKTTADGLAHGGVVSLFVSGANVYAGTNLGGLSISTNGGASFSSRDTSHGLGSNEVYAVYSHDSYVYVGTRGGLAISSNGGVSFTNRTTLDGLGDNNVYSVKYAP